MQVSLQRIEPGLYAVVVMVTDGRLGVECTPLRISRHHHRRDTWWQVGFDKRTKMGEIWEWQRRLAGENWDVMFGSASDGFETLRDARLKLEEVLGAVGQSGADSEAVESHLGGDPGVGPGAGGGGCR